LVQAAFDCIDIVRLVEFRASPFQRDHAAGGERKLAWHRDPYQSFVARQFG